ncbi:hypothetical protein A2U01_0047285, partial [Trifolium medium]|nr:hypothetical protein [Trifolium medium]
MEGSSSNQPQNLPLNFQSGASFFLKGKTMDINYNDFDLVIEQPVDFKALKVNEFDVEKYFTDQGWSKYFDILNGQVYPILVKDFWPRCEIFDKIEAEREYALKVAEDLKNNKGKTREKLGLKEFNETEIRSCVSGAEITLTQSNIAQLLGFPNE